MQTQKYLINNDVVEVNDPKMQWYLANAYNSSSRPLCLCRYNGIDMYIAKVGNKYILKRMPNSAEKHYFTCTSYIPPAQLSGRGQFDESAIKYNSKDDTTNLQLGFALSKKANTKKLSSPLVNTPTNSSIPKTDGNKLSLKSLLHYLWETAGFNRYSPNMKGKRNWFVIRKHLLEAAKGKTVKKHDLTDLLYIPEIFKLEEKELLAQRRNKFFSVAFSSKNNSQQLLIIIAQFKEIKEVQYGYKIVFKHIPDYSFLLNQDIYQRLSKAFATEFDFLSAVENSNLIAIATFSISNNGYALIQQIAVMNVSQNWIPFTSIHEYNLLYKLVDEDRKFFKPLRYELSKHKAIPASILTDCERLTAIYIKESVINNLPEEEQKSSSINFSEDIQEIIDKNQIDILVQDVCSDEKFSLPEKKQ